MPSEKQVIRQLYDSLGALDGQAMGALYTTDARFSDPIFRDLRGSRVGAMWRMLCRDAADSGLELKLRHADGAGGFGQAVWEARYEVQGRPVHNVGHARFAFRDGLIVQHTDEWHFYKWASQALGWKGRTMGWTQPFHDQVSHEAERRLDEFAEGQLQE